MTRVASSKRPVVGNVWWTYLRIISDHAGGSGPERESNTCSRMCPLACPLELPAYNSDWVSRLDESVHYGRSTASTRDVSELHAGRGPKVNT